MEEARLKAEQARKEAEETLQTEVAGCITAAFVVFSFWRLSPSFLSLLSSFLLSHLPFYPLSHSHSSLSFPSSSSSPLPLPLFPPISPPPLSVLSPSLFSLPLLPSLPSLLPLPSHLQMTAFLEARRAELQKQHEEELVREISCKALLDLTKCMSHRFQSLIACSIQTQRGNAWEIWSHARHQVATQGASA